MQPMTSVKASCLLFTESGRAPSSLSPGCEVEVRGPFTRAGCLRVPPGTRVSEVPIPGANESLWTDRYMDFLFQLQLRASSLRSSKMQPLGLVGSGKTVPEGRFGAFPSGSQGRQPLLLNTSPVSPLFRTVLWLLPPFPSPSLLMAHNAQTRWPALSTLSHLFPELQPHGAQTHQTWAHPRAFALAILAAQNTLRRCPPGWLRCLCSHVAP